MSLAGVDDFDGSRGLAAPQWLNPSPASSERLEELKSTVCYDATAATTATRQKQADHETGAIPWKHMYPMLLENVPLREPVNRPHYSIYSTLQSRSYPVSATLHAYTLDGPFLPQANYPSKHR